MSRHVVRAPSVMPDMDTGVLFEKYSVEEIREIEKKTRQDIEKKKEDLRQMVGERYRDLIEAADTISEMKRSTEHVVTSIVKIQELCQGLKQSSTLAQKFNVNTRSSRDLVMKSEQTQVYGTAVNLKLLMDMPEKIWSGLDSGEYLLATCQYLLARHVYTAVQLDSQSARIATHFPVLTRQWTSISHFRATILQTCRAHLKDVSITSEAVCDCLCSILLIEDCSTMELFDEFLSTRVDAIRQLFESDSTDVSVRLQLCNVVTLIVTTVHQINSVFHHHDNASNQSLQSNYLMTALGRVTSKDSSGAILSADDTSSPAYRYLSSTVRDFRPALKHAPSPISANIVKERSLQYITKCRIVVHDGLTKLLGFIPTVKGLATIRDEIWVLLKQEERKITWNVMCEKVFDKHLSIWDEFMRDHFVHRVKTLLQSHFDTALSSSQSQIGKVLTDLANLDDRSLTSERDILSYIWTEGAHDIPTNMTWLPVGEKTLADSGALIMKARAYTPAVQNLCRGVDQKVKVLLDDVRCYIQPVGGQSSQTSGPGGVPPLSTLSALDQQTTTVAPPPPFDQYADAPVIHEFIQTTCENCFSKLMQHLEKQLSTAKQEIASSNDVTSSRISIDRVLLLGRFSSAICELSSHLQLCMSSQLGDEKLVLPKLIRKPSMIRSQSSKTVPESPRWITLKDKLLAFRNDAYHVWIAYTSTQLISQFKAQLLDTSARAILLSCTQWDCIEIDEETEAGSQVKSTIRVPMQASWYVQTMLYSLCEDVNRIGGQSIHWSLMRHLVELMLEGILSAYESLVNEAPSKSLTPAAASLALSQNRSVQLLFDIKFLTNLLLHKDESQSSKSFQSRLTSVVSRLESRVDPFDLDVFYPYIQNHLQRQSTRSEVLYGSLMADKHAIYGSNIQTLSSSGQEQHNILPLSTSQTRFPLLPLSMQNRSTTIQPIVQPPKAKPISMHTNVSNSASLSVHNISVAPPRVASGSFLEQMSTMWFSSSSTSSSSAK